MLPIGSKELTENNESNSTLNSYLQRLTGSDVRLPDNYVPMDQTYFTEMNIQAMSLLIKLFERKHRLVQKIKEINDIFEQQGLQ